MSYLLTYIRDGKRLTGVIIAVLNLVMPFARGKLLEAGITLPEGSDAALASWVAVAVLNAWSKYDAVQQAKAGPP